MTFTTAVASPPPTLPLLSSPSLAARPLLLLPSPNPSISLHGFLENRAVDSPVRDFRRVGRRHDDAPTNAEGPPCPETISLTGQTNLLPRRKAIAVFFGLALCILVSCLDATIVATALPTISATFNAGSVASWVPSGYLLAATAFQPLCESSRLHN